MTPLMLFISSVQKELAEERRAVRDFVRGDPLLRRFFDVWLFEDQPASDQRADQVYLSQVDNCALYIGLLGDEYGAEDKRGKSPTEHEFNRATQKGKPRLVFVKGTEDGRRHPKMLALISKAGSQLVRKRFSALPELTAGIYASLVEFLERTGAVRTKPFDAAACPDATLADLARERLAEFLSIAKTERGYPLASRTSTAKALAHLNLLDGTQPSHAAVLLFGKEPQRFLLSSEIKCMRFHGKEVRKPIPAYHVYKGTLFELVDQAVDFVMSKIDRAVIPRDGKVASDVEYELPYKAVREAIVNAVTHRDYASNASAQVMLFADRLEVWNPGDLPPPLTLASLRKPHASIPHNPLIAEPMFLATYAEKAGSGILDMMRLCRKAGLRPPAFRLDAGQFVQTLWRPLKHLDQGIFESKGKQSGTRDELGKKPWITAFAGAHEEVHDGAHEEAHDRVAKSEHHILEACRHAPRSTPELLEALGYGSRTGNFTRGLKHLIDLSLLERTIPEKPRSKNQEYRLTEKGLAWLRKAAHDP